MCRSALPNVEKGIKIARALGVTVEWLFDNEAGLGEYELAVVSAATGRMSPLRLADLTAQWLDEWTKMTGQTPSFVMDAALRMMITFVGQA